MLEPAGENPGRKPFDELPFDMAETVDEVLEENKAAETMWEGWHLVLASDRWLANVDDPNKDQDMERAWKVERADGRLCYIWTVRRGGYGLGKAKRSG